MMQAGSGRENNCCWRFAHPQTQSADQKTVPSHIRRSDPLRQSVPTRKRCVRLPNSHAPDIDQILRSPGAGSSVWRFRRHLHTNRLARFRQTGFSSETVGAPASEHHAPLGFRSGNVDRDNCRHPMTPVRPYCHKNRFWCCGSPQRSGWAVQQIQYSSGVSFLNSLTGRARSGDPKHAETES